ncbi:uncharacterized protein BCR38DRAFT_526357 [Pseudomassariella vexata]|uniref:Uncharacterized protein n=1 Tax=Pseudomassariella vexata TaxID=1141098 RepID=A0A1Y2DND3_9PEZI|nr:uncharacterized protein BCR38DRAFT_526357 [Pseudomassariella vexata]ORY60803.1 hypothetical protein BCR38DRAFT_526357 [Pseudomassariella vexata]
MPGESPSGTPPGGMLCAHFHVPVRSIPSLTSPIPLHPSSTSSSMYYKRAGAPELIPDGDTIEALLGEPNDSNRWTRSIKTWGELNLTGHLKTGLVTFGKRQAVIQGGPFAYYLYWAGNVGHLHDDRVSEPLGPICDKLIHSNAARTDEIERIGQLLEQTIFKDLTTFGQ